MGNDTAWDLGLRQWAVATAKTGTDGKYQTPNLAAGDYVVYALLKTKDFALEWCVGVSVKPGASVQVDLSNDNAARIVINRTSPR